MARFDDRPAQLGVAIEPRVMTVCADRSMPGYEEAPRANRAQEKSPARWRGSRASPALKDAREARDFTHLKSRVFTLI